MTSKPRAPRRTGPKGGPVLAVVAIVTVSLGLFAGAVLGGGGDSGSSGDTGPMGGEVIDVPGTTSGVATAGAVRVDGAAVAMGDVPLDVTVTPTWTLENTGPGPVTLGDPHAEVVDGCCPGPLTLGSPTLEPGAETALEFPLQMHLGMDGPHDFRVHVPVQEGDSEIPEILELRVTGDFY